MRTSELTGALLDYWVARAEGFTAEIKSPAQGVHARCWTLDEEGRAGFGWHPSTSWAQGGPIIEREVIGFGIPISDLGYQAFLYKEGQPVVAWGKTHLIAAMRAYVASKFGDEVAAAPSSEIGGGK